MSESGSPQLRELLLARSAGAANLPALIAELRRGQLLVPLLEVRGDQLEGDDLDPCAGRDKAMAAVSLRQPDGTAAGLAFTGLEALTNWNARARPLPRLAGEVADSVLRSGGRTLHLDIGADTACVLRGLGLLRLATGEPWPDPWQDAFVHQAIGEEFAAELANGDLALRPCAPTDSTAGLGLEISGRGAQPDLGRRLAASPHLRAVYEGSVEVRLLSGATGQDYQ
ncbi:MAG: SseB family protein [Candidatus Nanopelagicales bacterium]